MRAGRSEFDEAMRLFALAHPRPHRPLGQEPPRNVEAASRPALEPMVAQNVGRSRRRFATALFSVAVTAIVTTMTVGMTTPAEALPHGHPDAAGADSTDSYRIQAYVAPAQAQVEKLSRPTDYGVVSAVDIAAEIGVTNYSDAVFTNDTSCAIQWPYAVGVPMTYGYGMRAGRMHKGIDLVPGQGAQIQAIAEGVVRESTDEGGDYGVQVIVDHTVNGKLVSSRYAHMEYGSRQVEVGDTVRVGDTIGRTGNSGFSFGAHLHFEILDRGSVPVDPVTWLRAEARC